MALWCTLPEDQKEGQHTHIVQVANGAQHALLLTDEGIVYSWGGKNERGELGRTGNDKQPSPVTELIREEIIVQIACGLNHCLVLSQNGALFAWGSNKAGQVGIEGFRSNAPNSDLEVRAPRRVKYFNGKDKMAKSISCGPESSACVTVEGEVYVWGAVSYWLFNGGQGYDHGDNFTVPVKVRGVPEVCRPLSRGNECFVPDQIAVYKDQFACTIGQKKLQDDLIGTIKTLKKRSTQLTQVIKSVTLEKQGSSSRVDASDESEELKTLSKDLKNRKKEIGEIIQRIKNNQERCRTELQRIGRELTICDQQDIALSEVVNTLEVKRNEVVGGKAGPSGEIHVSNRALDTQLRDIDHFKESNRRSKLQFFEQREACERENLRLSEQLTQAMQERQQVEGQEKLIRSLRHGDFGSRGDNSGDDGLRIAVSKRVELAATEPQTLAGAGRFTGFREVLAISERALQDVSSALKEVSAASSSGDGILEGVLEQNLKLRKECVEQIKTKLEFAERGRDGATAMNGRPAGSRKEESLQSMVDYFEEVGRDAQERSKPQAAPTPRPGLFALPAGGLFGALMDK